MLVVVRGTVRFLDGMKLAISKVAEYFTGIILCMIVHIHVYTVHMYMYMHACIYMYMYTLVELQPRMLKVVGSHEAAIFP